MPKASDPWLLLKSNLKQLRLPTMLAEFEKLSREAATANEDYPQYLLRLTELELATRQSNALRNRIKQSDLSRAKGLRHVRLHGHAVGSQTETPGTGSRRMD